MKAHACFRVTVDEVAEDFAAFAELAQTRTFEIYDNGKVEVMLVRTSAIPEWDRQLQKSIRTSLMTQAERDAFQLRTQNRSHRRASNDDPGS